MSFLLYLILRLAPSFLSLKYVQKGRKSGLVVCWQPGAQNSTKNKDACSVINREFPVRPETVHSYRLLSCKLRIGNSLV